MKDLPRSCQLPIHNEVALEELRKVKEIYSSLAVLYTAAGVVELRLIHSVNRFLLGLASKALLIIKKIERIQFFTEQLFNEFKNEDVQVFPLIQREGLNSIDLFIRFPRKTHLFISVRSKGNTKIVYHEAREILQVRKKKRGGLSTWLPCPLVELADYKTWLDKNRNLFGMSSKEAQKTPTTRVLVLCYPTKIADHKDHLFTEIGVMKALILRKKGSAFMLHNDEFINFVRGWLARYR